MKSGRNEKMIKKAKKFIREVRPHTTNIFWSNLNQMVITIMALLVSIVFANFATKELYGQYLFVLSWFGLFLIVSIPGAQTVVFRTSAQGYDGVYRKATMFRFLCSLFGIPLLMITGIIFYLFKSEIIGVSFIGFSLFFPFMTSLQNWTLFLKGRSQFRKLAICNLIKLSVNLIAVALSIIFAGKLVIILGGYFLVNSGFNIFYYLKLLKLRRNDNLDANWKKQSYALTTMTLSTIAFGKVDVALMGTLLTWEQVAVYNVVMKFVNIFFSIIKSTVEAILPNLYQSKKITIRYFYKFFAALFLIPIILYPLVKYPILFLYRQYPEVIGYAQVYLTVIPFYFLNMITTHLMVKYKLNKEINISRIVSIVAVIVLYAVLIPLYGIWGGVISSMLYFILQLVLNLFMLKSRNPEYSSQSENTAVFSEESTLG